MKKIIEFIARTFIVCGTIAFIFSLSMLAYSCKHKTKQSEMINVAKQDSSLSISSNSSTIGLIDTLGNVFVTNIHGDTIFRGNINDTLKKPCITCRKTGKYMTCSQYKKENQLLRKMLKSCEKGDYYTPSIPKSKKKLNYSVQGDSVKINNSGTYQIIYNPNAKSVDIEAEPLDIPADTLPIVK